MPVAQATRLPTPTTDLDQVRRDLADFGYGLLRDALTKDQVARYKDRVLEQAEAEKQAGVACIGDGGYNRALVAEGDEETPWQVVRNLLNKGRMFEDVVLQPDVYQLATELLGPGFILSSLTAIVTRGSRKVQAIHSDQQGWLPFDTPSPLVLNTLYMITDFAESNGATRVVPGSHKGSAPEMTPLFDSDGNFSGVKVPEVDTVPVEGPAGTAFIFEGRTWHEGPANPTGELRIALSCFFSWRTLVQQDVLTHSLNDDVLAEMSDDMKRLCGFFCGGGVNKIDPGAGRTNMDIAWPHIGELHLSA